MEPNQLMDLMSMQEKMVTLARQTTSQFIINNMVNVKVGDVMDMLYGDETCI